MDYKSGEGCCPTGFLDSNPSEVQTGTLSFLPELAPFFKRQKDIKLPTFFKSTYKSLKWASEKLQ